MTGGGWLRAWPVRMPPLVDLLCFAGAGAGASAFAGWAGAVPAHAALLACQLPGREERIAEPPPDSLAAAADNVAAAVLTGRPAARPLVLFGHSMGGTLAFEVAARLAAAGRAPRALVLAASSPRRTPAEAPDDAALRALLIDYDPANRALLDQPDLAEALMPVLAADIAMLRRHGLGEASLPVPAHLLSGTGDRVVRAAAVAGWARHLTGPVAEHALPGGHRFAFDDSRSAVLGLLGQLLGEAARGG